MGPPHLCGGMSPLKSRSQDPNHPLQWGRRISAAECSTRCGGPSRPTACFNGAAASLRRNVGHLPADIPERFSLQWGRRISAAECIHPADAIRGACSFNGAAASLRRNAVRQSDDSQLADCFNGAAASLRRNGERFPSVDVDLDASMGPPHLCGGMRSVGCSHIERVELQWGRRISAAEWRGRRESR